jgi:hypothetical protein
MIPFWCNILLCIAALHCILHIEVFSTGDILGRYSLRDSGSAAEVCSEGGEGEWGGDGLLDGREVGIFSPFLEVSLWEPRECATFSRQKQEDGCGVGEWGW